MSGKQAAPARAISRRRTDVDMTSGSIIRHIITFALPLLAGNIFQQLYNMVDTWVVGKFVSNEAYAAVGSVGPIINMLIGAFMGLSSGAGVVISQYYGAHRLEDVRKAVHTAVAMTLILGVIFTGLGLGMTPFMLRLMKTPANVLPESKAYLFIYFSGIMGLMLYNIGAGILRAVGDSKRPFYFLVVCAVMNTVLDLLFVIRFRLGVRGVALATILSQSTSAVLVLIALMRTDSCVKVRYRLSFLINHSHATLFDRADFAFEINGYFVEFEEISQIAGICKADTGRTDEVVEHFNDGGILALQIEFVGNFATCQTTADDGDVLSDLLIP